MKVKVPASDPEAAYVRRAIAKRRVAKRSCHRCGERRPTALIRKSKPTICAACQRWQQQNTTMDDHHIVAVANGEVTARVPINDHRAELSQTQNDWPRRTRDNPEGSPALAAAANIRGAVDFIVYLIRKCVLWVAEFLEALDAELTKRIGPTWWLGTPLEAFAPTPPKR